MQSYSTFSVGGTVAVNAHGITSDHSLHESVVRFVIVTESLEVVECSREAADERARELFSLAIGGYGLFGVISEV
jgi:decaprenylphospho-beta-D-ribofuranose 2-oxidase